MVHLTRIGYKYFGELSEDMRGIVYDGDTNILLQVFENQFKKLNPGREGEYIQVLKDIRKELNDDDLGRGFYNRLKAVSPIKLIDYDNIGNNTFHFTAEFTCKNGQDEFRPDITLFVNGLPLCFVEVKKPNNHGGIVVESSRMNRERFPIKVSPLYQHHSVDDIFQQYGIRCSWRNCPNTRSVLLHWCPYFRSI